jgi:mannose-6-phosphate isomerase-like protein (cupin superfamily)
MKIRGLLLLATTLLATGAGAQEADYRVATVITSDVLDAAMAAAPADAVSDEPVRHVESAEGRLGIGVVHRPALEAGGPVRGIQHHQQSEVYRVMAGAGVLVTSRALSSPEALEEDGYAVTHLTGPSSVGIIDQPDQVRRIATGDVVIIPAGLAHGFSEISSPITYMVVRVDPQRLVALK